MSQLPLPKYDQEGIFKSYFQVGFDRLSELDVRNPDDHDNSKSKDGK